MQSEKKGVKKHVHPHTFQTSLRHCLLTIRCVIPLLFVSARNHMFMGVYVCCLHPYAKQRQRSALRLLL